MLHHAPHQTQVEQLRTAFPTLSDTVFEQLVGEPRFAPVPDAPGEFLPYIRPNEGAGTPLLIVPGWGVGRMRRLAFAGALAARDVDVILPGQNRSYPKKVGAQAPLSASLYHAHNYESVLQQEDVLDMPIDFVAQSYGCLVLETLVAYREAKAPGSLRSSSAFLLAPALKPDPRTAERAHRFEASKRSELNHDEHDFPDHGIHMLWANTQILLRNRALSLAEDTEMRERTIDFEKLCPALGHVVLMMNKEDKMFPPELRELEAQAAVRAGATWVSPYSLQVMPDGTCRGGRGATHNDEQFNPSRVVDALLQLRLACN